MTWRLKTLILYQRGGDDRRRLDFNLNGVNVITGNSKTGKSAVLEILNYVLMSKSCPIPKGIIRRSVSHVGAHLVGDDAEMLVIRPLPAAGSKTSTEAWYTVGRDLEFPHEVPEARFNRDTVRDVLSEFTGITGAALLSNAREPWEEVQAEANIRHAAPLCFQPQDVIANRHVSVPGLDREHHRRHMLDALPFLLGIEDAEVLAARSELRRQKAELRTLKMAGLERKRLRASAFARGHKLWLEAQARGLVRSEVPESVPELLTALRDLQVEEAQRFNIATSVPDIHTLENAELGHRKTVQDMRRRIRELRAFEQAADVHGDVVARQVKQLSVGELLPDPVGGDVCPVCEEGAFNASQRHVELRAALQGLESIRAVPLRADSKARKARVRLERELVPLEEAHEAARARLREAVATVAKNSGQLAADRAIDMLHGQIIEYVRSVDVGGIHDADEEQLEVLEARIEELQKKIDGLWARRKKVQDLVDERMTELARKMEVEFQNGQASISIEDLSINVQIDPASDEMTSLAEVGSGANWVCYHLAAILALHTHLATQRCPVPRLLVIDQPSQAWFPEELKVTGRGGDLVPEDDDDTDRVRNIYRLLDQVSSERGFSQIIVMDHAKFANEWFQAMVRYEWRHGEKLVPDHWDPSPAEETRER